MNKSTVLKFLPIISICILALATTVVCLGIFSNNAKAVSTTINLNTVLVKDSFVYGDKTVSYVNTEVIIQVVDISDNTIKVQVATDLATLKEAGVYQLPAAELTNRSYYALKFLGPTFSSWQIVNTNTYTTDYYIFQASDSVPELNLNLRYSQTQETWFDDTNMI